MKLERRECPVCHRTMAVYQNGTFTYHQQESGAYCPKSNMPAPVKRKLPGEDRKVFVVRSNDGYAFYEEKPTKEVTFSGSVIAEICEDESIIENILGRDLKIGECIEIEIKGV